MKITIVQGAFLPVPPEMGGAVEKLWFAIGKEFVREGHEVIHISRRYRNMPANEIIDGVSHKRIGGFNTPLNGIYYKFLDFIYSWRARGVIDRDSDIIITNTFFAPIIFPNKVKPRIIVSVERMPKGQMKFYHKAGALRANSTATADAIKAELKTELHHKVFMVPNALTFTPVNQPRSRANEFLYVGRVNPEKGLDILIKAFLKLPAGWKLKIVGPYEISQGGGGTEYLSSLKALAGTAPIEFTGPIFSAGDLNEVYQSASVFIYPSTAEKGETFGLAPLEAMAWGTPPIVSDLSCFKDFITDGVNGLVFDHRKNDAVDQLAAKMNLLMSDADTRAAMGQEALKVGKTHSTVHIANLFADQFEKLIYKRGSR